MRIEEKYGMIKLFNLVAVLKEPNEEIALDFTIS